MSSHQRSAWIAQSSIAHGRRIHMAVLALLVSSLCQLSTPRMSMSPRAQRRAIEAEAQVAETEPLLPDEFGERLRPIVMQFRGRSFSRRPTEQEVQDHATLGILRSKWDTFDQLPHRNTIRRKRTEAMRSAGAARAQGSRTELFEQQQSARNSSRCAREHEETHLMFHAAPDASAQAQTINEARWAYEKACEAADAAQALAARLSTRGNLSAAELAAATRDSARKQLHHQIALQKERLMWKPAAFHRSFPNVLHRTLDRARDDPPPRSVEVICYVPRSVAVEHGYGARQMFPPSALSSYVGTPRSSQGTMCIGSRSALTSAGAAFIDGAASDRSYPSASTSGGTTSAGRIRAYVPAEATDPWEISEGHPVPIEKAEMEDALQLLREKAKGNITWFHPRERSNPINFWEQRLRCYHCGCDHFVLAEHTYRDKVASMHLRCCQGGRCVLHREHALPDALLDIYAYGEGVSSASRNLNSERRLCAQGLPRGTSRVADRGGGTRIVGVTFAVLNNALERSAIRAFLDDPACRHRSDDQMALSSQPSPRAVRAFFQYVDGENPLFQILRRWHNQPYEDAYLLLRWEGSTSGVRSLCMNPCAAELLPRTALVESVVFSRDEVQPRRLYLKATNDMYPLVMWPLAFPHGRRLRFADGTPVDDWLRPGGREDKKNLNLQQSTMILFLQPERRDGALRDEAYESGSGRQRKPGSVVLMPTANPYGRAFPDESIEVGKRVTLVGMQMLRAAYNGKSGCVLRADRDGWRVQLDEGGVQSVAAANIELAPEPYIWRRANRFQMLGKLADEVLLDRWNSVVDHRLEMLAHPTMQKRLTGQLGSLANEDGIAANATEAGLPTEFDDAQDDRPRDGGESGAQDDERGTDGEDEGNGRSEWGWRRSAPSYLPPTEDGSPRNQAEKVGHAMFLCHTTGGPLFWSTMTFDPSLPEFRSRLPMFDPRGTDTDRDPDEADLRSGGDGYPLGPGIEYNANGRRVAVRKVQQEPYEATALHAEVFEYKHLAYSAVMQSGSIFRNVGRPRIVGWRLAPSGEDGEEVRIPQYEFPLSIDRRDDGSQGYDMDSTEYQQRNFAHIHKATRPARIPPGWSVSNASQGQRLDWIDMLTCARLPDRRALLDFGMLGRASAWRTLDGVCRVPGGAETCDAKDLYPGYEYLACDATHPYGDDDMAVHPDIVHDFGGCFEDPNVVLTRLTRIVGGQARRLAGCTVRIVGLTRAGYAKGFHPNLDPEVHNGRSGKVLARPGGDEAEVMVDLHPLPSDDAGWLPRILVPRAFIELVTGTPTHYSNFPYTQKGRGDFRNESVPAVDRRGRMIHCHPKGPSIPNGEPCGNDPHKCTKAHFPKPVSAFTTIGVVDQQTVLLYRRGPEDIMVVAWNGWVLLYFDGMHINTEVVVSDVNVVAYMFKMFKYIFKAVGVGEDNSGELRSATRPDEIGDHFKFKETSGTEAFRRHAQMASVTTVPRPETVVVHTQRARALNPRVKDEGLSDLEKYFARPPLPELDGALFAAFQTEWLTGRTVRDAPQRAGRHGERLPSDPPSLAYYVADGRAVHRGTDPSNLRLNPRPIEPCYYWKRAPPNGTDPLPICRLKAASLRVDGEAFYLRKLLLLQSARSFEELCTSQVSGEVVSAEECCREAGLLDELREGMDAMREAVQAGDSARALRSLFVMLAMEEYSMEEVYADAAVRAAMAADFAGDEGQMALDLHELYSIHNRGDSDAMSRMLPTAELPSAAAWSTEWERACAQHDAAEQRALALTPDLALDGRGQSLEQTRVVHWVLTGEHSETGPVPSGRDLSSVDWVEPSGVQVMVVHGDAGVGKSRIAKRAMAEVRGRDLLARPTAFTWFAARNLNGTTLHYLGCMGVKKNFSEPFEIRLQTHGGRLTQERHDLLCELKLIIYDEAFSGERYIIEAFIAYLRSAGCNCRLLLLGDAQQLQPVKINASLSEKLDASLVVSPTYRFADHRVLLRVQHRQHGDTAWGNLVRSVGDGTATSLTTHALHRPELRQAAIQLPLLTNVFHEHDAGDDVNASMRAAVEWLFGRVDDGGRPDPTGRLCTDNVRLRSRACAAAYDRGVRMRAILCATNALKNQWNELVRTMIEEDCRRLGIRAGSRTYTAVHSARGSADSGETAVAEAAIADHATDWLTRAATTVPLASLKLQGGDMVLLAKTMCARSGLVKNELFTVAALRRFTVTIRDCAGALHTVPRAHFNIDLDTEGLVQIRRKQLPLVHAWALTVHKSQGSTLERDIVDARGTFWEHGQAYVVLGRTRAAADTGAFVNGATCVPRSGGGPPVPVIGSVCHPELLARS